MLTIQRLSNDDAHVLIEGAARKATEIGVPMCIAVTDEGGQLIAFERMDGAKVSSISIAIDKAFTAAAARNPTAFYNEICVPGQPTFGIHVSNGGHFCVIGGGVPVKVDGVMYILQAFPQSDWVKNVRAAGQGTLVRGRSARRVKLIEVPPQERGPIARVFPEQVPMGAGIFVKNGVVPDKSPESFEKAAPGIPVFRVQPY